MSFRVFRQLCFDLWGWNEKTFSWRRPNRKHRIYSLCSWEPEPSMVVVNLWRLGFASSALVDMASADRVGHKPVYAHSHGLYAPTCVETGDFFPLSWYRTSSSGSWTRFLCVSLACECKWYTVQIGCQAGRSLHEAMEFALLGGSCFVCQTYCFLRFDKCNFAFLFQMHHSCQVEFFAGWAIMIAARYSTWTVKSKAKRILMPIHWVENPIQMCNSIPDEIGSCSICLTCVLL